MIHHWDAIRARMTTLEPEPARRSLATGTRGFHESLFRASGILYEVKAMLARGDSVETVATFIEWAEGREIA